MKISSLFIVLIFIGGCASQASDEAQPGSCRLECSDRKVPAASFKIEPLDPSDITIGCYEGSEFGSPITVRYQIYEVLSGNPGTPARAVEAENCIDRADKPGPYGPCKRMVGGVGFEPWVLGAVSSGNTNTEHLDANNSPSPAKFAGIVTPRSEWCSDTCGIMTYEVWPSCVSGDLSAGVLAGGASMNPPVKFQIDAISTND